MRRTGLVAAEEAFLGGQHLSYGYHLPRNRAERRKRGSTVRVMAKGAYGARYLRARAEVLASGARCTCGALANSVDHQPPLSRHEHLEGSGCCRLVPTCLPCQHRQGGLLRTGRYLPPPTRDW